MKMLKALMGYGVLGLAAAGMCVEGQARASDLNLIDGAPAVYTVKKGDTLWDIAEHYLHSPWRWPELWQSNRSTVADPHWIYPGDQLYLHWVDGQPRLQRKPRRYLAPRAVATPKPVTTLPADLLLPYLAEDKLLAKTDLKYLPHVIGDNRALGYIPRGKTVWVDMPLAKGDKWGIFRPKQLLQRALDSGETAEVFSLKEVARGEVVAVTETTSAVLLTGARREVQPNDVLLPAPLPVSEAALSFSPFPSPAAVEAQVLSGMGGMEYIATHETVVLDLGHIDGLAAGQVFSLLRPGAGYVGAKGHYAYSKPESPILPSRLAIFESQQLLAMPIGEVMVIRPYEYFSLAVVIKATEPFRAGAKLVSPSRG